MPLWLWSLGLAFLCGLFLLAAGNAYERIGERKDRQRNPLPGRMVSVGEHQLQLLCKGNVAPTVVIEQGAGEPSWLWWPVQDQVAKFASVCTYDRASYGWSQSVPAGRTITQRAEELHALLSNAGMPGPYILVAHSYGGLIVRCFARKYPAQTAGLVFVDTPDEATIFRPEVLKFYARVRLATKAIEFATRFGLVRLLVSCFPSLRAGFPFSRAEEYAAAADDLASLQREEPSQELSQEVSPERSQELSKELAMRNSGLPGSLVARPLVVLTHGQPFPGPFSILEKGWSEGQTRLAALSTNSLLIVAKKSNHMIELDEPELVVEAIRRVHVAVQGRARIAEDEDGTLSA
jgi:pimeloyl-ACP methyl ester carboxylesterase